MHRITWGQVGLVLLHVLVLGAWRWKSDLGALVTGDAVGPTNIVAGFLGGLGLLAFFVYQTLPPPERESSRRQFDRWSVTLHLLYTWALASCLALWAYNDYAATSANAHEEALKVWFLALGFFGGFLNLTRSTNTRSTTSTIHATTKQMARQLDLLRRGQRINGELYAQAVDAQLADTREELAAAMVHMVDAARAHPKIPPDRLTVSLWLRGQERWRILAGSGIADETRTDFTQAVIDEPTPEAGVVSNLAASADRFLVDPEVEHNPWYKPNPFHPVEESGMAVVLIEDFHGTPVGALCLTARPGTLLPSEKQDPDAYSDLMRLLMAWKIAFTLPVMRLMHVESP